MLAPAVAPSRLREAPCHLKNNSPHPRRASSWVGFARALEEARFEHGFGAQGPLQLPPGAPRSVEACLRGAWSFVTLDFETGELAATRFRCRSWRCPECRYEVARGDFARILEGLESRVARRKPWLIVTLTFDPKGWRNRWEAYRAAGRCWQKLRARLAREYGTRSAPARIEYLAVWEQHRSGWPHVHMAISCPELQAHLEALGPGVRELDGYGPSRWDVRAGQRVRNWAWKARVLDPMAQACGFGRVSDVQLPRASARGVAAYFAKLAAELVGTFDQRPVEAPRNFRRLRTSRRLLPPRYSSGTKTGGIHKRPVGCATNRLLALRVAVPHWTMRQRAWPRGCARPAGGRLTSEASTGTRTAAGARPPPHPPPSP